MEPPVIGLTGYLRENGRYCSVPIEYIQAVQAAGGVPVVLPAVKDGPAGADFLEAADGLVLTGGGDVSPLLLGSEPIPQVERIDSGRDVFELELFERAHRAGLPVLGVCRGCQVINAALGGALLLDIPTQAPEALGHNPKGIDADEPYHSVRLVPGSRLQGVFAAETLQVNSFHHQAVQDPGRGLAVAATAPDGIVEAVEGTGEAFLVGVQWHPECMVRRHPQFLKLFAALVEASAAFRHHRRSTRP